MRDLHPISRLFGVKNMEIALLIIGILALVLITQRWFWLLVFGFGGLASLFAMIASIFHFQILGAIGFFVLTCICGGILGAISDG